MRYYELMGAVTKKWKHALYDEEKSPFTSHQLYAFDYGERDLEEWREVCFNVDGEDVSDIPVTNVTLLYLYSDRLKALLTSFDEGLVWLPVNVFTSSGEKVRYYALHISELADVLDIEKTEFVAERIFSPHLSQKKIAGRDIFMFRRGTCCSVVSETVKDALEAAGITGLDFGEVPTS